MSIDPDGNMKRFILEEYYYEILLLSDLCHLLFFFSFLLSSYYVFIQILFTFIPFLFYLPLYPFLFCSFLVSRIHSGFLLFSSAFFWSLGFFLFLFCLKIQLCKQDACLARACYQYSFPIISYWQIKANLLLNKSSGKRVNISQRENKSVMIGLVESIYIFFLQIHSKTSHPIQDMVVCDVTTLWILHILLHRAQHSSSHDEVSRRQVWI